LVLSPVRLAEQPFTGGDAAEIVPDRCRACGVCASVCRFEAIVPGDVHYRVDALACEGCAACVYQCPEGAIRMVPRQGGVWFRSETRFGPLFHAHLFPAQENSGKLVTAIKQEARLLALDTGADLLLVDGPPGIGCPVISASAGADLALLVVEPTVAGVHDLGRALATVGHFGIPAQVVVNKADISPAHTAEITAYCGIRGIPLVGAIPYDPVVTEAMVHGQPVTAYADGPVTQALRRVWQRLREALRP
jgi:MinD superfamily P-loop ATPase